MKCSCTAVLAAVWLATVSCDKAPSPPAPGVQTPAPTNSPAGTSTQPVSGKLLGKWLRPDGGYILEIQGIAEGGQIKAGYFNPSPITVSKALTFEKEGEMKVFVELRDVNYPGCTYSLTYDPKTDQLYGEYFQAALGQRFDVTFQHLKE